MSPPSTLSGEHCNCGHRLVETKDAPLAFLVTSSNPSFSGARVLVSGRVLGIDNKTIFLEASVPNCFSFSYVTTCQTTNSPLSSFFVLKSQTLIWFSFPSPRPLGVVAGCFVALIKDRHRSHAAGGCDDALIPGRTQNCNKWSDGVFGKWKEQSSHRLEFFHGMEWQPNFLRIQKTKNKEVCLYRYILFFLGLSPFKIIVAAMKFAKVGGSPAGDFDHGKVEHSKTPSLKINWNLGFLSIHLVILPNFGPKI